MQRAMKDSGIEWIGEIPECWEVLRMKQLFLEVNERCEDGESYTLLSVSEYYGVAPRSERVGEDDMLTHAETLDGYKICKENDLVMNIMLAWKRALGVSKYLGIVSPSYSVYRGRQSLCANYFHYLFRTDMYANLFKQYSTGIIDSRLRLYPDKFLALKCQVPPIDTQHRIADYLDRKCGQIDAIIARQQEVIEKLKAYKRSVITEAVTKGLNPNVPMKDSGIEWIGKIPADWDIIQVRYLFRIGRGRVIAQTELQDDGMYPVFSSQTKDNGCLGYINSYDFDISQLTWTTDGANAGTVFLRTGKHNCTNVCGTLQPLTPEVDLVFQKYALEYIAYHHKRVDTNGFKIMNNEMASIHTILPPAETQHQIADYPGLSRKISG